MSDVVKTVVKTEGTAAENEEMMAESSSSQNLVGVYGGTVITQTFAEEEQLQVIPVEKRELKSGGLRFQVEFPIIAEKKLTVAKC